MVIFDENREFSQNTWISWKSVKLLQNGQNVGFWAKLPILVKNRKIVYKWPEMKKSVKIVKNVKIDSKNVKENG